MNYPIRFNVTSSTPTRECGECNSCCRGLLHAVEGRVHHKGNPCFFLGKKCTIYNKRPQSCRDYQCAYLQGIVPEWMKPSICGFLINVEKWGPNKEYRLLKAVEVDKKISVESLSWLVQFSRLNNIGLIYEMHGVWYFIGPDAFMEEFKDQITSYPHFNPLVNNEA